jgi:prepilin-type N-terminal cleavage/methylation domain-containing protein
VTDDDADDDMRRPSTRQLRPRCRQGFTLLELVLVMMLLTATLALAVPSLRGFVAGSKERDALAQVVALAQYAKARSAADAKVYRLNLDGTSYWLTVQEADGFVRISDDYGRTFLLPPGMRLESVPTNVPAATDGSQGGAAVASVATVRPATADGISFYPEGRTDAGMFRMTDASGRVTLLGCPSPAESFRVVSAEEAATL